MSTLPLPLLLLFLLTLPIRPYIPLRQIRLDAFLMPLSLPFIPSSAFSSIPDPRPFEIARCIIRLFLAYSLKTGIASILRTLKRIGGWKIKQSSTQNLLKIGLIWLLSWRCSTLPFLPEDNSGLIGLATNRRNMLDVPTVISVGTGLICIVDEVREIIKLIGLKNNQTQQPNESPKSGIISRIIQIILSIHRILLAIRIISATFAPVNFVVPIEPLDDIQSSTSP